MQSRFAYTIIFLLLSITVFAHGVHYNILSKGAGIEAKYDDGEPMSYCETRIFSPGNSEEVFQQGLTDANGRFMFSPDIEGIWKIIVNDGMGHGIVVELPIDKNLKSNITGSTRLSL